MELTPADLQEILKVFVDSDMQELQLQVGDVTLAVSKNDANGLAGFSVQPQARSATSPPIAAPVESPAPSAAETAASPQVDGDAQPQVDGSAQPQVDRTGLHALRSPSVGVFYRRPGPDEPPYVEVGDVVKVGDPVCTISVMKMFTQVGADRAGRIVEVCVGNETLVEHGQVLMYIEPLDEA